MESPIPGTKVMLIGKSKSGKTTSLKTIRKTGITPFVVVMDQPGAAVLGDCSEDEVVWKYISPFPKDKNMWTAMIDSAKKINQFGPEALQKLAGVSKTEYTQFIDVVTMCNNFVDRHGKSWGDISTWNTDRMFVLDPLTSLNKMSKNLTVGSKPVITQPEWGIMMDNLGRFIDGLVVGLKCHFCLIGHIEPERDEVTGAIENMISTLGRKLAPVMPTGFTDVILQYKEAGSFHWATDDPRSPVGARHLANSNKLPPDFGPLIQAWQKAGGVICPTEVPVGAAR